MSTSSTNPPRLNLPTLSYPNPMKKSDPKSILWSNGTPESANSAGYAISLSELPTDHHDLYLQMNAMAAKVTEYSAAAFTGERFRLEGSKSQSQLQLTLNATESQQTALQQKRSRTSQDISQFKESLSTSHLPKVSSYSERGKTSSTPTKVDQRKAIMAKCLQMEDASLSLCLAPLTQDLTPEEKKQVIEVVHKAPVGELANYIAAPFAALNKVVKTAFKIYYLAEVHHYCIEVEPHNNKCVVQLRQGLEGRNPEVNKAVKEAMPGWVLKTGEALESLDHKLHDFDGYMAKNYYSHPGLIHAGAEGMIDVGLGAAAGAAVKIGVKGLQAAIKPAIKSLQKGSEVKHIAKFLSKPLPGEAPSAMISLTSRMKLAASKIKEYPSPQAFLNDFPKAKNTVFHLKNSKELLPEIARGRSSSEVYFVFENKQPRPLVVKDFAGLISSKSQFAMTLISQKKLNTLNLSHFEYPLLKKAGQYLPEGKPFKRGLLLMTQAEGKSLTEWLNEVKQLPIGHSFRSEYLSQFCIPIEKTGMGIAELHRKSLTNALPCAQFIESECQKIMDLFVSVEKKLHNEGLSLAFGQSEFDAMIAKFKKNPGYAGCSHGDPHFQNFIWDPKTSKLSAIDAGSLAKSLNAQGQPIGVQATDLAHMKVSIEYYGRGVGLTDNEISMLNKAFFQGYAQEFNMAVHTTEALSFYDCYWNLLTLNLNSFEKISPTNYIRNLNCYFGGY